jgi:hypothetical protein
MRDLWKETPKPDRLQVLSARNIGLVCPSCGTQLRVTQSPYGAVVLVAGYLGFVLVTSEILDHTGIERLSVWWWFCVAVVFLALEFLRWRYAYYSLTVRVLGSGEQVSFPLQERRISL